MEPAVLFINALWTEHYNGTEEPIGNFAYLKTEKYAKHGASDEFLFTADDDGTHHCGLGQGAINVDKLDAVFVARDPRDNKHKVVAVFRNLSWKTNGDGWTNGSAHSDDVTCFPPDRRAVVRWPLGQRNRRWARGGPNRNWHHLLKFYEKLISKHPESIPRVRSTNEAQLLDMYRNVEAEEQQRLLQQIYRAVRDQQLRPAVLKLWGSSCAACGMSLETPEGVYECEVAHIHQVREQGTDSPSNALPLCRTHHWAFDQHLWGIVPTTNQIFVRDGYRDSPILSGLHQSNLKPGREGAESNLDLLALRSRWKLAHLD
jgi:hypothetical protein